MVINMKNMKNTFFLIALISVLGFIGCNNNSTEYLIDNNKKDEPVFSQTGSVINGILVMPQATPAGAKISAEKNTFRSNTEITITEKDFSGKGSDLLVNSNKAFEIRGVIVSDDPLVGNQEIKTIEKDVKVVVPNTIAGKVNGYFLGIKDDEASSWRFQQINYDDSGENPMSISSVRANVTGSEFTFYTNKLGFQFALFADMAENSMLTGATVVEKMSVTVQPENASDSKEVGKLKIKEDKYCDNMQVNIRITGRNVNSLKQLDYKPEIIYVNNNYNDNRDVFGKLNAKYESVEKNSGTSNGCVHKITINNFDLDNGLLKFVLNTDGVDVKEFPSDFIITVKDSGNLTQTLPFDYSNSVNIEQVHVVEPEEPKEEPKEEPDPKDEPEPAKKMVAPRNVIVSNSKFSLGQTISISWDSGNPDLENVVYDVLISSANASETAIAASLTETVWTLDASENTLGVGSYTIRIAVRNQDGKTLYSDNAIFYIVDDTIPETSIIDLKDFYLAGEDIEIKWNEVHDPLGNSLIYSLLIWKADEDMPAKPVYLGYEPSYIARNIATGSYKIKVTATNGSKSTETGALGSFKVVATTKADISIASTFIGDDGLYSRQSEFTISLSEKNYEKPVIESAIKFEGSDGTILPQFTWNEDVLTVKFNNLLERNHNYSLSMEACKDIYGNDIVTFNKHEFATFFFEGKGDLAEPYTWDVVPSAFEVTALNELPLIGSITVDISDVLRSFTNITIDNKATLLNGDEVVWTDLAAANEVNRLVVGIGNENLWKAAENLNIKVKFSGQHNGKTVYFVSSVLDIKTEDGMTITMGQGNADKPYLVYTNNQLDDIRNHLANDILLLRDLDLAGFHSQGVSEGEGWEPIGYLSDEGNKVAFTGSFDGNGKTISNLTINSDRYYVGLFGFVQGNLSGNMKPGSIKNFRLCDVSVVSLSASDFETMIYSSTGSAVGAAIDNVEILNIDVTGNVAGLDGYIGGVTGNIEGNRYSCTFENCSFSGVVKETSEDPDSTADLGGCVGFAYGTVIKRCKSSGSVIESSECWDSNRASTGGIVGNHMIGLLSDSTSNAEIYGCNNCGGIGGLVYFVDCIDCSYNGAKITATNEYAGGICGNFDGNARNCKVTCDSVNSGYSAGGVFGSFYGKCSDSYCEISGGIVVNYDSGDGEIGYGCGGFAAFVGGDIVDCHAITGYISCIGFYAGGFFGSYSGNSSGGYPSEQVKNCYCKTGYIKGGAVTGGFAGQTGYCYFVNCKAFVDGNITTDSYSYSDWPEYRFTEAGGFAGILGNYSILVFCSTEFDSVINADYYSVGGFGGTAWSTNVSNCYAKGNLVRGADVVGGFIASGVANVTNCYTTTKVEAVSGSRVGEFMDYLRYYGSVNSCFSLANSDDSSMAAIYDVDGTDYANVYKSPNGYDSSLDWGSHEWNPSYWNLDSGTSPNLPTLKENINPGPVENYPCPEY